MELTKIKFGSIYREAQETVGLEIGIPLLETNVVPDLKMLISSLVTVRLKLISSVAS